MTRTERQKEAIKQWIRNKGKGSVEACTGFGKTRIGLMTIKALMTKYPQFRILIVVPTTALKDQWRIQLDEWGFAFNSEVYVVNTVIKHNWTCDFLVLDECHRFSSNDFSQIFTCVKYKFILGLTATFERLDGKHVIMQKYCPIVDRITFAEALANGWVADYKEYIVLLDVDDIEVYNNYNKEWVSHFEFFEYDFDLAMSMTGKNGWQNKLKYRDKICPNGTSDEKKEVLKSISYHAIRFTQTMQQRKSFINNHPKKIEVAKKIIEARSNKKIITFSNSVKIAESIGIGDVYTGRISKKRSATMIEDFAGKSSGVLNTVKKADEGLDIPGLSVAIILGTDSSETKARQRRGRTVRKEDNKIAEVFYLIIKDTVESKWAKNNHKTDSNYITIDEDGLNQVLYGKQPDLYKKKIKELRFRF